MLTLLYFFLLYIKIKSISAKSQNENICDCAIGFSVAPSSLIGWSCINSTPSFEVCNDSVSSWSGIECNGNIIIGISLSFYGIKGTISSSFGFLVDLKYLHLNQNNIFSTIPSTLGYLVNLEDLALNNNCLSGTIPSSIGNLTNIQSLSLQENSLSGQIPITIGMMDNLISLRLYRNVLTNSIPTSIGQLIKLEELTMNSNLLTGTVPSTLGDMTSLTYLQFDYNKISGSLPSTIATLTNLWTLAISGNKLTGTFPHWLSNLEAILTVAMDFNKFSGTLPSSIGKLTNMYYFNPSHNSLTGTIPSTIGFLNKSIQSIYLSNNFLEGKIPTTLSNCTFLFVFDVSYNKLTGTIPIDLWLLPYAYYLIFGTNHFSGTLPSSLVYNNYLQFIELGENCFSGILPTVIGRFAELTYLSVRFNSFTGSIPMELGYLTKLSIVYLQSNQFTSSLPSTLTNITGLSKLFVSYNSLTGTIPSCLWSSPNMLYIDFSRNSIAGTIPPSIRNATLMQKLAATDTHLHGTLPTEIGYLTDLQYLYLSSNQLKGTLPSAIGKLKQLQYLDLHSNAFHGTIPPSFRSLPLLVDIYLRGNALEGPFSQAVNTSYQSMLRNIDVSDNYLTGTIPDSLFFSSTLEILAATSNCLVFPQLIDGCTASQLQVLSLDGLRTAEKCRKFFWQTLRSSDAYTLQYDHATRIPSCLYALPRLRVLHLSGNALSGSLPADVSLGPSLVDVTLSYNRLHGPIPEAIQRRNWTTLDLSFNSLSGTLSTSMPEVVRHSKLALTINRLSGLVPQSLLQSSDISILKGNIFGCDFNGDKIPSGDSDSLYYSCGSDTFLLALYTFFGAVLSSFVIYFLLSPVKLREYASSLTLFPVSNGSDMSKLIIKFCALFGAMTVFILCVMMPVFGALSRYYGTHTNAYAWSVSAGFLSGLPAKIILLVVWLGMLSYFLVWYALFFRSSDVSTKLAVAPERPVELGVDAHPRGLLWDNTVLILLFGVNVVVVFAANSAYVLATLRGDVYAVVMSQILLGIFKLIWRYGYIEYIGVYRDCITGHTHRNKHELLFLTLMLIVNNVVLPLFSEAVVDTNCIYNMFVAPDPVAVAYRYETCYLQSTSCDVLTETTVDITYVPPFLYRYQCSATIITNYISVYCYMYIFTALQIPLSSLVVWLRRCFHSGSWVYTMISLGVHQLHDDPPHLNYPLYVAGLLSSLAILVTFGAAFPPLAVIITIATYVDAIYVTNILPVEAVPVPVDELGISVYLIPFSALFFSFFLYDTADYHKYSWVSLWAPMTLILVAILLTGCYVAIVSLAVKSGLPGRPYVDFDTPFDTRNAVRWKYGTNVAAAATEGTSPVTPGTSNRHQSSLPPLITAAATGNNSVVEGGEFSNNQEVFTMINPEYIINTGDVTYN